MGVEAQPALSRCPMVIWQKRDPGWEAGYQCFLPLELWALISTFEVQIESDPKGLAQCCLHFCGSWQAWGGAGPGSGSLTSPRPSLHSPLLPYCQVHVPSAPP